MQFLFCRPNFGRLLLVLLFPLAMMLPIRAFAGATEYEIKAAHIYNFAKFVEYPERTFASSTSPFVIGIIGSGPLGDQIQKTLAGQSVWNHPIMIHRYTSAENARSCQIVLLLSGNIASQTAVLHGSPALTITEGDGDATRSAMISLFVHDNHVRFNINIAETRAAHLRLSAQVVSLAKNVINK